MSCQQAPLVQEDPYIFTDTISNHSTNNFMQHNNSQTKYVPLNRTSHQTIYSRPITVTTTQASNQNGYQHQQQSQNTVKHQQQKYQQQLPATNVAAQFNGTKEALANGNYHLNQALPPVSTFAKTLSSFKVPENFQLSCDDDGQYLINNSNNHSINHCNNTTSIDASETLPQNILADYSEDCNDDHDNVDIIVPELKHEFNTGIEIKIEEPQMMFDAPPIQYEQPIIYDPTTIKYEAPLNGKHQNFTSRGKVLPHSTEKLVKTVNGSSSKKQRQITAEKNLPKVKTMAVGAGKKIKKSPLIKKEKKSLPELPVIKSKINRNAAVVTEHIIEHQREWHAPDALLYDYLESEEENDEDLNSCQQSHWFYGGKFKDNQEPSVFSAVNFKYDVRHPLMTRDERLGLKKIHMRRQANQYWSAQKLRSSERARNRFRSIVRLLKKMNSTKEKIFQKQFRRCTWDHCHNEAIIMTEHCLDHILLASKEQLLIKPCSYLYEDHDQCRIPVYDVMTGPILCREHIHLDNSNNIDLKPKKLPVVRKKPIAITRPVKRNNSIKKKKSPATSPIMTTVPGHRPTYIIHPHPIQQPLPVQSPENNFQLNTSSLKQDMVENHQFIHHNSGNLLASSQPQPQFNGGHEYGLDEMAVAKQDLMTICENSYESSEDTGVGGLSESELMSHDVIENIPFDMESCAELTKVLSSIAPNTLDYFFTEPLDSHEDEEYLDRALEEVNGVASLDQISIDYLDAPGDMLEHMEFMDDNEQRLMAATNLMNMSMQSQLLNDLDHFSIPMQQQQLMS